MDAPICGRVTISTTMFLLAENEIEVGEWRAKMLDPSCGAVVVFEGLVRNHHEGRAVRSLRYEHHPVLAQREGERILAEAAGRFPTVRSLAVHRVGELAVGECAVVVLTASAHRAEAYEANQFLIDEIKSRVPIWKQECYESGEVEWTSPCVNCGAH